jgi:tetratricopeptide (TPR) repeat protein
LAILVSGLPRDTFLRLWASALISGSALLLAAATDNPDQVWQNLVAEGQQQTAAGQFAKAEQTLQKAIHEAERFGAGDWRVAVAAQDLGHVYAAQHRTGDAEAAYRRALLIFERADGMDSIEAAHVDFDLARVTFAAGRSVDALLLARKALPAYETSLGAQDLQTAAVMCLIGDSLRVIKNFRDSEEPLEHCAAIREQSAGIDSTAVADASHSLALVYMEERKYTAAEARFRLVEKIRENRLGLTNPALAQTFEDHAEMLHRTGSDKEGARLRVLAAAIRRSSRKESVRDPATAGKP